MCAVVHCENTKEVECPRQRNNYDCGIYIIIMIEKIIRNLKNNTNIERLEIYPEEAGEKRKILKNNIIIDKDRDDQARNMRKEKGNESYIRELQEKIKAYPKLDRITMESEEERSGENRKRSEKELKEIHRMTEKLLMKQMKNKSEKEEKEIEEENKRITRSMRSEKENKDNTKKLEEIKQNSRNKKGKKSMNKKVQKGRTENTNLENEYRKTIRGIPAEVGKIDLEIMLINIRIINADKVQQIVEGFLTKRKYVSIFCLTETQVKSIGFKTQGIKMHTKERKDGEKKGGGLAIGYIENKMIELVEKDTGSNDVMVLEGLIYGENIRIILTYMDCSKMKSGKNYEHNRKLQKIIEK